MIVPMWDYPYRSLMKGLIMRNWKKVIVLSILVFCALGCEGSMSMHYPGKWNAIDVREAGNTRYLNYRTSPEYPEVAHKVY